MNLLAIKAGSRIESYRINKTSWLLRSETDTMADVPRFVDANRIAQTHTLTCLLNPLSVFVLQLCAYFLRVQTISTQTLVAGRRCSVLRNKTSLSSVHQVLFQISLYFVLTVFLNQNS